MNVLMLSWEYPPNIIGGLGAHVAQLAPVLAAKGVPVYLATPRLKGGQEEEERADLHVFRVDARLDSLGLLEAAHAANEHLYNRAAEAVAMQPGDWLVHAHDWLVMEAARRLKRDHRLPLLATIHATEYGRNHGIHNELQRQVHEREKQLTAEALRIIACSRFMAGQIRDVFQVPADKIDVIPNGVDSAGFSHDEFDRKAFRANYATASEKLVLYVGRLVPEKGINVVLAAIPKTLELLPEVKFIIVGSGPALDRVRAYAADQEWAAKVVVTGFVDDRTRNGLYQVADVAIFPSLYEPFGIVALEAMAAGTPIVVSNSGGLAEVVERNRTGVVVDAGSEDSLAWGIVHVLTQPTLSYERVERARRQVAADYNWNVIADKTIEVYRRVAELRT